MNCRRFYYGREEASKKAEAEKQTSIRDPWIEPQNVKNAGGFFRLPALYNRSYIYRIFAMKQLNQAFPGLSRAFVLSSPAARPLWSSAPASRLSSLRPRWQA